MKKPRASRQRRLKRKDVEDVFKGDAELTYCSGDAQSDDDLPLTTRPGKRCKSNAHKADSPGGLGKKEVCPTTHNAMILKVQKRTHDHWWEWGALNLITV